MKKWSIELRLTEKCSSTNSIYLTIDSNYVTIVDKYTINADDVTIEFEYPIGSVEGVEQ